MSHSASSLFLDMFNNNSDTSLVVLTGPRIPSSTKPTQPDFDNFYLRQRRTVEIIELVEVPPPSRGHGEHLSVPCSSSSASSYCSSSEDSESVSSYCSSDLPSEPRPSPRADKVECPSPDVAWHTRMRRVEAWRDAYAKAVGAEFAPSPSRTKRKGSEHDEDDMLSRCSKRSRQTTALSVHSCSACNASFASRQGLRRHGRGVRTNEACRAAVEYGFE